MSSASGTATVCQANIGAAGRRRRTRAAVATFAVGAGVLAWMMIAHVPAMWRLLLSLPIAMGTITGLQVTRNTCVAMASMGVVENEDFSTKPVEEELARASKRVAATIVRDGILVGVAGGLLAAATAWLS
jgi:hypothetical protein